MKVLLTGGAGYVGSCICSALLDSGHTPVILDTLASGREYFVADKIFYKGDVSDKELLNKIFAEHKDIEYTIHCAERASVDVSVFNPYEYYISNVVKSMELLNALYENNCKNLIFCSSASVYEDVPGYLVTESSPINPRSPFARSKYIMEMIIQDFCKAYDMRCITLRYFNPIGADSKLRAGLEDSNSTNIISRLIKSANDNMPFTVSGDDWGTRDGTCIRDYVHIMDVALAHVKALENFDAAFSIAKPSTQGYLPINIGSGNGITVKEVVLAFENVIGDKIKIEIGDRRAGDIAGSYASIKLANQAINWECQYSMEEAILDSVRWEDLKKKKLFEESLRKADETIHQNS